MRLKILLILITSILTFQGCITLEYPTKITAVPSSGQRIMNINGREFISSQKKHLVLLSPYTELGLAKDKTIFLLSIENLGDTPVNISEDNISVTFEGDNKMRLSNKIKVQSLEEFMKDLKKEFKNNEKRLAKSRLGEIKEKMEISASTYSESDHQADYDKIKVELEKMRSESQPVRESLEKFVMTPQTIMPGKDTWNLVVCDTRAIDKKIEGSFQVTVSVAGEEHRFVFSRSISDSKTTTENRTSERATVYPAKEISDKDAGLIRAAGNGSLSDVDAALIEGNVEEIDIKDDETSPKTSIQGLFANSAGMSFVYIAPGTFMSGSPEGETGRDENERQHKVKIKKGFYMGVTEVTQGQWKAVMGANPSYFSKCGDDCPVEQVSWNDAKEFIKRLNSKEGTKKYRLPTDTEWEYACRAGSTSKYSFGNDESLLKDYAWFDENSFEKTHPVASLSPNAWGLYDMHGNVWEWVQDSDYPPAGITGPIDQKQGTFRVKRSGSWSCDSSRERSANRSRSAPGNRVFDLGFRIAMTL